MNVVISIIHGKIEMDFFFITQKKSLCRVYVTQSRLERPFHVAGDMSSKREFRCTVVCISQFHCGNEVKQGQTRPDYLLDRIDSWCRF